MQGVSQISAFRCGGGIAREIFLDVSSKSFVETLGDCAGSLRVAVPGDFADGKKGTVRR